ncbi:ParB/RepB/Spo0J family partition protein [Conexibacter sp. CPCC 206217]|uniref:ParB/RepB/Spo0J family partition protein n=1 Tax=Conexibacter sp. CPCC 206217 TaxID=3064574 RepID=UPI00271A8022|nr:ParB/RepB/Spo0J family partition protein [Conexibacter sp. CPCC 206217]MDO8211465.1 ParB/RepB/Spo0J family partition protein [Conexibacter sp. CPCC 206217]
MAEKPRGMGRGLSAILSAAPRDEAEELRTVPIDLIAPNPHQPRRHFEEEALVALAQSLSARGVLQPVLVRPLPDGSYELIAGERRWRAARIAGIAQIPAIVRHHDDAASLELAVIENMAREDLNPVEEARACAALVEELSLTREDVGRRVGRSRVAVSNLIRLLDLPDDALVLLERGELSEGHGRALLLAPDHGDRRRLGRDAAALGWSVRELERRARGAADADAGADASRPPRRTAPRVHPDQQEAVAQLADVFSSAVGADVDVAPAGSGYRVQLSFETLDDALALARRLGVRAVA